jgi:hypothetical protein
MKEIYKNPTLYYILVPIAIALWPLLVWAVYLPRAESNWKEEQGQYNKAQEIISKILSLDAERLEFADLKSNAAEFDYANAIEKVATSCNVPSSSYQLSSGILITSGEQKSQNAKVVLKQVDIAKFAKFLSTIQLRWANLQCTQVKLTQKKGLPDVWDVDLDFKYYY